MTEIRKEPGKPDRYEIRVQGQLDDRWSARFPELTLTRQAGGTTMLSGRDLDQAALHALLRRIRDLGLPLVSVDIAAEGSSE